ncbi:hypothetical protein ACWC09_26765 [Streptomyces sp. NPDC001617]
MLGKYRHVPSGTQVIAVEWTGSNTEEVAQVLGNSMDTVEAGMLLLSQDERKYRYTAEPGEMVVVGFDEPFVCDAEIFQRNYEPLSAP